MEIIQIFANMFSNSSTADLLHVGKGYDSKLLNNIQNHDFFPQFKTYSGK